MNGIISDTGEYRRHGVRIMGTQVTGANYLKVSILVDELSQVTIVYRAQDLHPFRYLRKFYSKTSSPAIGISIVKDFFRSLFDIQ
jgi:hypothetical protein